jgi:carbon-monoxide dehydrogenase iron sulfur subunit
MNTKRIVFEERNFPENCIGCRICEIVCSFVHERAINPKKSRIHVVKYHRYGLSYPVVCLQCTFPKCAQSCPTGAIDRRDGMVQIDETKCIGCGTCASDCPIGAITMDADRKIAIKCDLCNGDPECVKKCPRKVLGISIADDDTTRSRLVYRKFKNKLIEWGLAAR